MATILTFRPRCADRADAPPKQARALAAEPAKIIVFPKVTLSNLCEIAEAMAAGRQRAASALAATPCGAAVELPFPSPLT